MTDDKRIIEQVSKPEQEGEGIAIEDFVALLPQSLYIFTPCREPWVAKSVNSRLGRVPVLDRHGQAKHKNGKLVTVPATNWLDQNRAVTQMTWAPGWPMLIEGRMVVDGGWITRKRVTCFNLYRPPRLELGDANTAGPWLDLVFKIFKREDAEHIIRWLAQRVQKPQEKINHALVLGGAPGVGKDSLLEPVKYAVGPWNFHDISPTHLLGDFNGFAKSVILRVNEARDLGGANRFAFYDKAKIYNAAPPDVLRVNEKFLKEHYVFNCVGCIYTTNYKTDGIYLPADDRRHYVAWATRTQADFEAEYWNTLWRWYATGGFGHVAAYLAELDLSGFDAKTPPPKTEGAWDIVTANNAPEDAELADILDALGNPDAVIRDHLIEKADGEIADWLMDRRNRRAMPHRMERCGYTPVRNPNATDGLWRLENARQVVYAKTSLTASERRKAAEQLCIKKKKQRVERTDE